VSTLSRKLDVKVIMLSEPGKQHRKLCGGFANTQQFAAPDLFNRSSGVIQATEQ